MRIGTKIALASAIAIAFTTVGAIAVVSVAMKRQFEENIQHEMLTELKQAASVLEQMETLHADGGFDLPALIKQARERYSGKIEESPLYRTIPVVASWKSIEAVAKGSHQDFFTPSNPNLTSPPRNAKNDGKEFAHIFAQFANPAVSQFVGLSAQGEFVAATPIRLTKTCLTCHGDPASSTTGDGKDPLGIPMENMRVGDLKGAFILSRPADHTVVINAIFKLSLVGAVIMALSCGILFLWLRRAVTQPLGEATAALGKIAAGDLRVRVAATGNDEISTIANSVNTTAEAMHQALTTIGATSHRLTAAGNELQSTSRSITSALQDTNMQASSVSAAAEQISRNTTTVATGMEEMTASVHEITQNAQQSAQVSGEAAALAERTNGDMEKLSNASAEIGEIIETISSIAEQTNLLALNATIEAARAGEAGKGFAVVANEVKELARETARATAEISSKIEAIQGSIGNGVKSIAEIRQIISRINLGATSIAGAVEEQSATTREIGSNVTQVAQGSKDIAKAINEVAKSVDESNTKLGNAQGTVSALAQLSLDLQQAISRFSIDRDAAR